MKRETDRRNAGSSALAPIAFLLLGLVACTGPKPLPDAPAAASQQPTVESDTSAPLMLRVSDPGTPAGLPPAPAEGAGEAVTPEAAQILKEHGYDPGESAAGKSGSVQVAQAPTQAGGQMPIPEVDPFASKEQGDAEIEEYDPWEGYNSLAFEFNYKFDKYLLKPVAKGYNFILPDIAQRGISNFFTNIRVVPRLINNVLQAKFRGAGIEGGRFLINSTLGVAGFFDPAKEWLKLETPVEDTGQTFGRWGFKPGPYLVIPFLGSFTVRDGLGYVADLALDPFNWLVLPIIKLNGAPKVVYHNDTILFAQLGMRAGIIVNERSLNLEKFQGVEESTLDLYTAVRNAYLQQRAKLIRE